MGCTQHIFGANYRTRKAIQNPPAISKNPGCATKHENRDCGAPGGIRTPNLLIRSQMLYPLSYGRIFS